VARVRVPARGIDRQRLAALHFLCAV
jgi:hypothetical protein